MTKILLPIGLTSILFCSNVFSADHDYVNDGDASFGLYTGHVNSRNTETDVNNSNIGFGINASYYFLPYLGVDIGYGYAHDIYAEDDFEHLDLQLKARYPLSDYANLSVGVGNAHHFNLSSFDQVSDDKFMLSVGVDYLINPSLSFNVGYAYYDSPVSTHSSINSLNFGINYHFGNQYKDVVVKDYQPAPSKIVVVKKEAPVEQKVKEIAPIIEEKAVTCQMNDIDFDYRVKEGDWLYKIAFAHDMSLDELVERNPKLINSNLNLIYPGARLNVREKVKICK
ncbi:outer membrane beta-barrel protein [Vibrio sp. MA40-2]|uniref:outer membrane beta-barrel protein n=1 Tax=Vibrio sp. MA40-2 TaxID=3391828 RepID=UPI0039A73E66